jgi:hypothetical protein
MSPYFPTAERPMHKWRGISGRWYNFSIYPINAIPSWITECNYIFARPRFDQANTREPFYIGETGNTDRFKNHEKMAPALRLGASELHIHFLAKSRWERLDIETDLRHGHWTPLNEQSTSAPKNMLAALGGIFGHGEGIAGLGALSGFGTLAGLGLAATPPTLPYSYPFQENPLRDLLEPRNSLTALVDAALKPKGGR